MPAGLDMGSANHGSAMIAYTMSSPACNTCMLHVLLSIGHCDSLEVQFMVVTPGDIINEYIQ